jgi:hypothetical protein
MAIVFTTGTISQPDAGSVGMAVHNKIRDDVVAHPAWELVEEFTPGGGTVEWIVLKCLATESGLPNDFFVVVGRRLSDGRHEFYIGEEYTLVSHTLGKFGPYPNNSPTQNLDSEGRTISTYVLGTAFPPTTAWNPSNQTFWTPSGTSTKWWLIVKDDGFTVAFNGAANGFVHIGAFEPLTDLAWPMPLLIVCNSQQGLLSSNPALAGAVFHAYGMQLENSGGSTNMGSSYRLGYAGDARFNDALQSDQRPCAELAVMLYTYADGDEAVTGRFAGKQKDMRMLDGASPPGFAFGDAYSLNGTLWVPYLPTDLRIWDTGVAAA